MTQNHETTMILQTIISEYKNLFRELRDTMIDQDLVNRSEKNENSNNNRTNYSKLNTCNPLFLLLIAALFTVITACSSSTSKPAAAPPPTVAVSTPVQQKMVQYDQFTGRFKAIKRVEVLARVDGYLQDIRFKDGEIVHKGEVLFVIDQRPYKIALEQAQAKLKSAKTRLKLAKKMYNRVKGLRKTGAVSQELLDQRRQEFYSARSNVKAAQAAVHTAALNLEYTKVKAPITGKISHNFVSEGNLVSGGLSSATLLTRIVSLDPIYFSFEVSEGRLIKYLQSDTSSGGITNILDKKLKVEARLLGEDTFTHQGRLDFVDNVIDQSTGTLKVRAIFNNDNMLLTPGMFATVRFAPTGRHRELLIPAKTIASDQAKRYVLVVSDSNTVKRKFVKTGPLHHNLRIIESGLSPKDRIIVSGFVEVRAGQKVTIKQKEMALAGGEK